MSYEPVRCVRVNDGVGMPSHTRLTEGATQTFKRGAPLIFSSGNLIEATFSGTDDIVGFASEDAHNLAVAGTAEELSVQTPNNQANAKTIPLGAPIKDGRIGLYKADGRNIFRFKLLDGQTATVALLASGTLYGLTKDGTTGFWYLDPTDTAGNNAVLKVVALEPSDTTVVYAIVDDTKRYYA